MFTNATLAITNTYRAKMGGISKKRKKAAYSYLNASIGRNQQTTDNLQLTTLEAVIGKRGSGSGPRDQGLGTRDQGLEKWYPNLG